MLCVMIFLIAGVFTSELMIEDSTKSSDDKLLYSIRRTSGLLRWHLNPRSKRRVYYLERVTITVRALN